MNTSNVLTTKELEVTQSIREQLSGLTLQEAYTVVSAVKGLLEIMGREADDYNEFILG